MVAAVIAGGPTAASALGPQASQRVDGVIAAAGVTCTWTDATASAGPPADLTIDRSTVNAGLGCSSGASAILNNNPTATFDDVAGTATSDLIDITVKQSIVSCRY
ncbi:hypothetical protein [Streptomyces brevispora]|uniref:Uncharacterized protein n=1 Tax=Streptomyces brevispora TaxID=887462 RepID=A0A561V5S2_9ACTN|nr:hypothetical protein [Streptomyces brevispora]TWG06944.1 hypothetical protein FHX80_115444 [Streptomyces brevispora]WSC12199.1 hypothetical protein OIE64_04620 [Streptomyces brevispora]